MPRKLYPTNPNSPGWVADDGCYWGCRPEHWDGRTGVGVLRLQFSGEFEEAFRLGVLEEVARVYSLTPVAVTTAHPGWAKYHCPTVYLGAPGADGSNGGLAEKGIFLSPKGNGSWWPAVVLAAGRRFFPSALYAGSVAAHEAAHGFDTRADPQDGHNDTPGSLLYRFALAPGGLLLPAEQLWVTANVLRSAGYVRTGTPPA